MRKIIFAAIVLASPAFAADQTPSPPMLKPDQQATVTLTVAEWQKINASVADSRFMSARDANDLNQKIVQQVNASAAPKK